jgi:hypothetical protein
VRGGAELSSEADGEGVEEIVMGRVIAISDARVGVYWQFGGVKWSYNEVKSGPKNDQVKRNKERWQG